MKNIFIADMKEGDIIDDIFVIKSMEVKVGRTGKEYLDMLVSDRSGDIYAKKWDVTERDRSIIKSDYKGSIVKIIGDATSFQNVNQIRAKTIDLVRNTEGIEKADLFKAAPENPIHMYNYIIEQINSFEDEELKKLCLYIYEENKEKLLYYPAAMSNHHAEFAGLLYHVKRMMMAGDLLTKVYTRLSRDLLLAGVALHDMEKLNEIMSDENGISDGYSFEGQMLGHLVMGVRLIDEIGKKLEISYEKRILIEHMMLSHHYEPEFGSPKKPLFEEAEILHYLDMMDAKMFDMEDALIGVDKGSFSNKVWTLDNRKIYNKKF